MLFFDKENLWIINVFLGDGEELEIIYFQKLVWRLKYMKFIMPNINKTLFTVMQIFNFNNIRLRFGVKSE